jgi:hypothetical protein
MRPRPEATGLIPTRRMEGDHVAGCREHRECHLFGDHRPSGRECRPASSSTESADERLDYGPYVQIINTHIENDNTAPLFLGEIILMVSNLMFCDLQDIADD